MDGDDLKFEFPLVTNYQLGAAFEPDRGWCYTGYRRGSNALAEDDLVTVLEKQFSKQGLNTDFLRWYRDTGEGRSEQRPGDRVAAIALDHISTYRPNETITAVITAVEEHVSWQLRPLPSGTPCWSFQSEHSDVWKEVAAELALMFPALFLMREPEGDSHRYRPREDERLGDLGAYLEDKLRYHRQVKRFSVQDFRIDSDTGAIGVTLGIECSLAPYRKGQACRCVPIPGRMPAVRRNEFGEPISVHSPEVVLANELVEEDLQQLSHVWQDRFAKSVLVCGPPGAGKENYARSLPYGAGRKTDNIQTISFGESTTDQIERRLFGMKTADGSVHLGLIEKAKHSAVFVDEAHYPENAPGARATLLRVLEAGTYYPHGSEDSHRVEDVLWVFASSRDTSGPRSIGRVPPVDFWTRMTHLVQVHHPLSSVDLFRVAIRDLEVYRAYDAVRKVWGAQDAALRFLFKFFWWSRLEDFYNREIPDMDLSLEDGGDPEASIANEKLRRLLGPLDEMAIEFARFLLNEFGSSSLHTVSIRGIRTMVGQLLSHLMREVDETSGHSDGGRTHLLLEFKETLPEVVQEVRQVATLPSG